MAAETIPSDPFGLPNPLGRYQILKQLGRGGMGAVFLACDQKLGRLVALKIPDFGPTASPTMVDRFYREARTAALLHHPNLCSVFDVDQIDGVHYLTMAYIEGLTLSQTLKQRRGSLGEVEATHVALKLARAMAVAHEKGVIHRDLKPSNVMVTPSRELVVLDFGLARFAEPEGEQITLDGTVMGTPAYMSPEQIRGDARSIGPPSDIYSLGAILYEMLTGRPPYEGPVPQVLASIMVDNPPHPSILRHGLDPALEIIVLKAMAKTIDQRYSSMDDFSRELEAYLDHRIGSETVLTAPPLAARRPPRRPPLRPALEMAGVLGLLGIVIWIMTDLGRIKLDIRDPDTVTAVRVDGRNIEMAVLNEPMSLRAGTHHLSVTRRDLEVQTRRFSVRRGGDEVLVVEYSPFLRAGGIDYWKNQSSKISTNGRANSNPSEITNKIGIKLKYINSGEFSMGSDASDVDAKENEKVEEGGKGRRHRVCITRPFYLGATEVTVGQFRRFVEAVEYLSDAERDGKGGYGWDAGTGRFRQDSIYTWRNPGFPQTDDHPVVNVSWNDATAFCEWLSREEGVVYRLPTEAEMEYSCRAGTTTLFSCGNDPEMLAGIANTADGTAREMYPDWWAIVARDGFVFTAPVGHYKANAWGLHDLHGNVWEWCSDWYDGGYYRRSPLDDPIGALPTGIKSIRGGSWDNHPVFIRSANRAAHQPEHRGSNGGFRVVRLVLHR